MTDTASRKRHTIPSLPQHARLRASLLAVAALLTLPLAACGGDAGMASGGQGDLLATEVLELKACDGLGAGFFRDGACADGQQKGERQGKFRLGADHTSS